MKGIILSLLLTFSISLTTSAQRKERKEFKKERKAIKDSTKVKIPLEPTGLRIGTNVISIISTISVPKLTTYEFNADFMLNNRYFITFDAGYTSRVREGKESPFKEIQSYKYSSSGTYYKIGIESNSFWKESKEDAIYVTAKLGYARFQHQLEEFNGVDDYLGAFSLSNPSEKGGLFFGEIGAGLKVKVKGNFYMGYYCRFKQKLLTSKLQYKVNEIPGFGIANKTGRFGMSYSIYYKIPFKEK